MATHHVFLFTMSNVRRRSVHKRTSAVKSPSVSNARVLDIEADVNNFDQPAFDSGPKSPKSAKGKSRKHSGDDDFGNGFDSVEFDGYRTRMVNVSLKALPAITKDKDTKKRIRNLLAKLQQCHVIIDFDRIAPQPRNRDALNSAKQVKRNALNECVNFVSSTKDIIDTEVFKAIVEVVVKNCFRTFIQPEVLVNHIFFTSQDINTETDTTFEVTSSSRIFFLLGLHWSVTVLTYVCRFPKRKRLSTILFVSMCWDHVDH